MNRIEQKVQEAQGLIQSGKPVEALALLQRVAGASTRDTMLLSALTMAASAAQELPKAEFYAKQLLALMPQHSGVYANLALILSRMGQARQKEAAGAYAKGLELDPFNDNLRTGFANMLMESGQPSAALAICHAAPHRLSDEQLTLTHAGSLAAVARCDEAAILLEQALEKFTNPFTRMQLAILRCAMVLNMDSASAMDTSAAHSFAGRTVLATVRSFAKPSVRRTDSGKRPLRVGVLSPDLRTHSVAFFTEPVLRHLDRDTFELHALHNSPVEDGLSARLRTLCKTWTQVHMYPDDTLVDLLRQQKFDIMLDLTGMAGHHRLRVLAARVAPLQVTYCGYPDTTGLPSVDYRVVDECTDPSTTTNGMIASNSPKFDDRCMERLWRLPGCFLCYGPPAEAPAPSMEPTFDVNGQGGIVFGSFNTARKISPRCVALWASVLKAVDHSALLLKSKEFADKGLMERVRGMFDHYNMADRVHMLASTPTLAEHLGLYRRVHIGLDTFPYHGTTTTCEAMWMGVPVITLVDDRHVSRVGVSLLHQAGLDDLVARNDDEFVAIAKKLAMDRGRLAALRDGERGLRERLRTSALCDGAGMGRRFGDALLGMWKEQCERGERGEGSG